MVDISGLRKSVGVLGEYFGSLGADIYTYIYIYNRVRPGAPAGCVFFPGNWWPTRVLGALPQGATFIRLGTCCDRFRGVREAVLEALGVILTCQLSVASCLFYACAQNCSF